MSSLPGTCCSILRTISSEIRGGNHFESVALISDRLMEDNKSNKQTSSTYKMEDEVGGENFDPGASWDPG